MWDGVQHSNSRVSKSFKNQIIKHKYDVFTIHAHQSAEYLPNLHENTKKAKIFETLTSMIAFQENLSLIKTPQKFHQKLNAKIAPQKFPNLPVLEKFPQT
jgi:hypothetical protein